MYKNSFLIKSGLITAIAAMIIIAIVLVGCQRDNDVPENTIDDCQMAANEIASGYLFLIDNQYVLNLTEEEALSLGISKSNYDRIQQNIIMSNTLITTWIKNGDSFILKDFQKVNVKIVRLKNGVEWPTDKCPFSCPCPCDKKQTDPLTGVCFMVAICGKLGDFCK